MVWFSCVSIDHVFVHEDVADEFFATCKTVIREFYGEQPQQSHSLARIINSRAHRNLVKLLDADARCVSVLETPLIQGESSSGRYLKGRRRPRRNDAHSSLGTMLVLLRPCRAGTSSSEGRCVPDRRRKKTPLVQSAPQHSIVRV